MQCADSGEAGLTRQDQVAEAALQERWLRTDQQRSDAAVAALAQSAAEEAARNAARQQEPVVLDSHGARMQIGGDEYRMDEQAKRAYEQLEKDANGEPVESMVGLNESHRVLGAQLAGLWTGIGVIKLAPIAVTCVTQRSFAAALENKWSVGLGLAALTGAKLCYQPSKKGNNHVLQLSKVAAGTAGLYAVVKYGPGLVTTFLK